MRLLVVTSPLVQIFQENYHEGLIRNPETVHNEKNPDGTHKELIVPRSAGPIKFKIGVPQPFGGPRGSDKDQDLLALADWLCGGGDGGMNQETDCYGVADLGLDSGAAETIMEVLLTAGMSGQKASFKALSSDLQDKMQVSLVKARTISENRVMREIRRINKQLEEQQRLARDQNREYQATNAEWLCRYVLRKEVAKQEEERKYFQEQLCKPLTDDFLGAPANG